MSPPSLKGIALKAPRHTFVGIRPRHRPGQRITGTAYNAFIIVTFTHVRKQSVHSAPSHPILLHVYAVVSTERVSIHAEQLSSTIVSEYAPLYCFSTSITPGSSTTDAISSESFQSKSSFL